MLEKDFYSELYHRLKRAGYECVRIESGSTEKGIPDLFVQGQGRDFWVELKAENRKVLSIKAQKVKVHYRSGQLAWALRYALAHNDKKHTYTMIRFIDAIAVLKMTTENVRIIEDNYIPIAQCKIIPLDKWRGISIDDLLSTDNTDLS